LKSIFIKHTKSDLIIHGLQQLLGQCATVNSNKWFAIAMKIPQNRLGTDSEKMIDIVNVKAEPVLISGLWNTPGFYPAYHMNKTNWITIALDGTAPDDMVKMLVNMSFEETRKKAK